jgi:hypothetical protein
MVRSDSPQTVFEVIGSGPRIARGHHNIWRWLKDFWFRQWKGVFHGGESHARRGITTSPREVGEDPGGWRQERIAFAKETALEQGLKGRNHRLQNGVGSAKPASKHYNFDFVINRWATKYKKLNPELVYLSELKP